MIHSWVIPGEIELIGKQLEILRFNPPIQSYNDEGKVLTDGIERRIRQAGWEAMEKQRKIEVRKLKAKLKRRVEKL